jgi:hypothetical protein
MSIDLLWELAHIILETKKPLYFLPAIWRLKKASGITQSKFKWLRINYVCILESSEELLENSHTQVPSRPSTSEFPGLGPDDSDTQLGWEDLSKGVATRRPKFKSNPDNDNLALSMIFSQKGYLIHITTSSVKCGFQVKPFSRGFCHLWNSASSSHSTSEKIPHLATLRHFILAVRYYLFTYVQVIGEMWMPEISTMRFQFSLLRPHIKQTETIFCLTPLKYLKTINKSTP